MSESAEGAGLGPGGGAELERLTGQLRDLRARGHRLERGLGAVASLLMPGAGQLLQGRVVTGLGFLAVHVALVLTTSPAGLLTSPLAALEAALRCPDEAPPRGRRAGR